MTIRLGQWSLGSLLITTALIPFLIFTLAVPNPIFASIAVTVASLTWTAMGIVALIDTGERRAFAIGGFLAPVAHALVSLSFQSDLNIYQRNWLLTALAEGMSSFFHPFSGFYRPDPFFSLTAQSYDALMLVFIGGYFARWVYRRRESRESNALPATPNERNDTT